MAFTISTTNSTQQSLTAAEDLGVITQSGALVLTSIGVLMSGEDARVINDGLIASGNIAISASNDVSIVNSGRIVGELNGITISISGVTTTTSRIFNSGEITAFFSSGINSAEGGVTITNSGLINGFSRGISLSLGGTVWNSGTISVGSPGGDAIATFGATRVVNTGTILGDVVLSFEDDVLDNRLGEIAGDVAMGNGANLFRGGATDESVLGGSGQDTFRGGAGSDSLSGGTGNDLLLGGDGDDSLAGGLNDDTLRGGNGDDTLFGSETVDVMYGGRGADVFLFTAVSESDTLQAADLIADFSKAEDVIDLTALNSLAVTELAYLGTSPLTGGGKASFGHQRVNGVVVLSIDTTGDGTADMVIHITGTTSLSAGNFLL